MSIRHRPMQPNDVHECVEIIAANPIVSARYGDAIADLPAAWLRLVAANGFCGTAVFEEVDGLRVRMVGIGATVFVSDDFVREAKTPPFLWIGPELVRRMARGDSPLLSEKQVSEANSRGGLNLAIWHCSIRAEDMKRVEVWNEMMAAFMKEHRGYFLKELVTHAECVEHALGMRNTGSHLCDRMDGRFREAWDEDLADLIRTPHMIGLTRQLALNGSLSWLGSLFLYQPPECGFRSSEQRLLLAALEGGTDEDLSETLSISLDTVKKTWRLIYERVAACLPELVPGNAATDNAMPRGKEKKQRFLAYLRDHPEELRPVSRKLLPRNGAQSSPSFPIEVGSNSLK